MLALYLVMEQKFLLAFFSSRRLDLVALLSLHQEFNCLCHTPVNVFGMFLLSLLSMK